MSETAHKTTTRRDLLGAAGFTGLAAVATVSVAKPEALPLQQARGAEPDVELIGLVDRLIENQAAFVALTEPYYSVIGSPPDDVAAKIEVVVQDHHRLIGEICDTPARTLTGYRAKAKAWMGQVTRNFEDEPIPDPDEYIAWSLCNDLMAGELV